MKQKKIDKRLLQLELLFAEVPDGDRENILGKVRELCQKIKATYSIKYVRASETRSQLNSKGLFIEKTN